MGGEHDIGVRLARDAMQNSHPNTASSNIWNWPRSDDELAMLSRSASDRDGQSNNRLSKIDVRFGDLDVPKRITRSKTRLGFLLLD